MKESDIRPAKLMDESDKLIADDLAVVMRHRADFKLVSCPACDREAAACVFEFEKDGFNFVRCPQCATLFVNPRPTAMMLEEFYSKSKRLEFWDTHVFPATEEARRANIFAPRAQQVVELCRKHGAATELLLDVGAGFGTFCEEVKRTKAFKRVVAIEPAARLAATCRRKGLEVVEAPVEKATIEPASVITNFELVEHLYRPLDFIMGCANALSPNGLLIMTTPNIMGFDLLTLGKHSGNVLGPNHINYFHPESLGLLLKKCGLEVVDVATPGKLDAELVRNMVLSGEFDISTQPFLKKVLLDDWDATGAQFQRYLAENRLSSHLWIVGRKMKNNAV